MEILNIGIASRMLGQFPISIATSLAIESACGIHPDLPKPSHVPLLDYNEIWINIRTLIRNFMGALDKEIAAMMLPSPLADSIMQEMTTIQQVVSEYSRQRVKIVFYISHYEDLTKKYKHAILRQDNTEKQKMYTAIVEAVLEIMNKAHPELMEIYSLKLIPKKPPKALIITHYAYDLLSRLSFEKLMLLESHTGKMKPFSQWYQKYYNGKDLQLIPFREDLIQVFGDNETFRPMDIKLRKAIIDVAIKYKWSSVTTRDRIAQTIQSMPNKLHKEIITSLLV